MRNLSVTSSLLIAFLFSFQLFAVDNPDLDQDVDQLNQEECTNQAYQQCLDDVCLTSDSTDCTQQCQSLANDKCQQQQDE
ncbi:hypothetical protein [Legionella waltersii]|uniref:Uncharacterized protein n=1 Tax=Legionella waltersii TaxID=66969 RepID=A0A0W1AAJ3_9GAMM|nr:hypothetical protein [Legionella waltersii]KTD78374.1 hypothetical protein Lwal_1809 [Legionella waltersii]SNV06387.1 Uncharacterised protein [Legionella waltersii]